MQAVQDEEHQECKLGNYKSRLIELSIKKGFLSRLVNLLNVLHTLYKVSSEATFLDREHV